MSLSLPHDRLDRLFKLGFIAKGTVYVLMGGLTLATVLGFSGGGIEGPTGVIEWVSQQALGRILVGLLGVGLLFYAIWRLYRGVADPTGEGHDAEGAGKRAGYVSSGVFNGALAVFALATALGSGGGGSGDTQESLIGKLLQQSYGPWLVGLLGVIVIGTGAYQAYKGYTDGFLGGIHVRHISRQTLERLGRYGHYARAVVFAIIGYFLVLAAVRSDADAFRGTEGALEWLSTHSYGLWLLGLTSLGLLFYGVYAVLKGYYGDVDAA